MTLSNESSVEPDSLFSILPGRRSSACNRANRSSSRAGPNARIVRCRAAEPFSFAVGGPPPGPRHEFLIGMVRFLARVRAMRWLQVIGRTFAPSARREVVRFQAPEMSFESGSNQRPAWLNTITARRTASASCCEATSCLGAAVMSLPTVSLASDFLPTYWRR